MYKKFYFLILNLIIFLQPENIFSQISDTTFQKLFSESDYIIIDSIQIQGNKKTRAYIIEKELTFSVADTLNKTNFFSKLQESKENIINTSLFLNVAIDFNLSQTGKIICIITVQERWYVFPKPIFDIADRNFNVWWYEQDHQLNRTEYGVDLLWYNLSGNRDNLGIKAITGYTQKLELSYNFPHLFQSELGLGAAMMYAKNKQLAYNTFENKHLFLKDSNFIRSRFTASVQLSRRVQIRQIHHIKLKYHNYSIDDTVAALNTDYFLHDETQTQFFSLSYIYQNNGMDDKSYPLEGYYAEAQIAKIGFGFPDDINQLYLAAHYNKYWKLPHQFYFQAQLASQFLFAKEYPYFSLISLGYCENFVRGYEYYVMDGEQTYLVRTNFKKQLFDWKFNAPLIHWKVFDEIPLKGYAKIFSDAGYVADKFFESSNELVNTFQYSIGAGIDITTYYDWVFRFEAALNGLGEVGLFFHLALDLNTFEDCNIW